uniref:large ribosomal subunit protein mL46 n=1 Tax=Myxine glutinosa TaxID=7769 RepID=UPI00358DDBE7
MVYSNMAAPMRSLASVIRSNGIRKTAKPLCLCPIPGRPFATKVEAMTDVERPAAPWRLFAATCVERFPVVTQERSDIEEQYWRFVQQLELQQSALSDHEVRLAMEADKLRSGILDDDDLESLSGQDLEEQYEKRFNTFVVASRRTEADELGDRSTHQRRLTDKLVLLFRQQVAADAPVTWCLPQAEWMPGESLRQTAERALITAAGDDLNAKFLGNAPAGFYKYKFPSNVRTENSVGGKIFFFKAFLQGGDVRATKNGSYVWVTKGEMQEYLKPNYLKEINKFMFDL